MATDKYKSEKIIFEEAQRAAVAATAKWLSEHPGEWFPCGFASVKIKPARGKFVSFLKEEKIGHVDTDYGGYIIYNPSRNPTQSMYAKQAGAQAFADVLRRIGIKAYAQAQID